MKTTHILGLLVWLCACGGTTETRSTTPASTPTPPTRSATDVDQAPRFSAHVSSGPARAWALHNARGISLGEHPSGGAVVLGCSEGPTDFMHHAPEHDSLAFVARVDPASGAIAWARHVRIGAGTFAHACRTEAETGGRSPAPAMTIDDAGRTFVSLHAQATDSAILGTSGAVAEGPTVLLFDADGGLLWSRNVGDGSDAVMGMALHPQGGVDVVVRRPRRDGLDENAFVHLDTEGELTEQAVLSAAAAAGRGEPCRVGEGGCGVSVEWVNRDRGGMLVIYGTSRGVTLSLGRGTVSSQADGVTPSGFWASFDTRGRVRWLREAGGVFTSLIDTQAGVLVNSRDPQSEQERALFVEPGYGRPRPATREALRGDAGIALAVMERQQRTTPDALVSLGSELRSLRPVPLDEQLTPEDVARLQALAPNGVATRGVRVGDGGLVRMDTFDGALRLGDTTLSSESSEQPTLALIHWALSEETMDSPERARVLGLVVPGQEVFWRMPASARDAAGCRAFTIRASASVARQARPSGYLRDPGRPTWSFTVEPDGVRIHSPSVTGLDSLASAACETRIAFEDFPHEDAASCESDPREFDLGECASGLASLIRPPEPPRHLTRRLRQRGRVWFSETDDDGSRQCEAWTVAPSPTDETAAAGRISRRRREGSTTTVTSFDYELRGQSLTLLGPAAESVENGEPLGASAMGCGETLNVSEDRRSHADVGGQRWFFTASACRAGSEEPGGAPSGC